MSRVRAQGKENIGMIWGAGSMGTRGCKRRGHVVKSTGVKSHRMIETDKIQDRVSESEQETGEV